MDERIKFDNPSEYEKVFSLEERGVLIIFYSAGYDLIKRLEEGDLVVAKVTKENEGNVIRDLVGKFLPEEWYPKIENGTEYYFSDIFDGAQVDEGRVGGD